MEAGAGADGAPPPVPASRRDSRGADLAPRNKGLDAALKAAEAPTGSFRDDLRAELVAKIAVARYMMFKDADPVRRAALLELWSQRKGQMIRSTESAVRP